MKNFTRLVYPLIGLAMSGFGNTVVANTSFENQAAITFNIDNTYAGLNTSGSFSQEVISTGQEDGGIVTANNLDITNLPLGQEHHFDVIGSVSAGSIFASYIGRYIFSFNNESSNDYSIQLSVGYNMSTATTGQDSTLILDFSDDNEYLDQIYLNASTFGVQTDSAAGAIDYVFNLGSGESKMFYVDVTSNAEITAAPVPLPPAVWSFLFGLLGVMGVNKRKKLSTQMA